MLRSLLLILLCWSWSSYSLPMDRVETWLPRSGQSVDIWNGNLTTNLGRTRPDIHQENQLYTLESDQLPTLHFLQDEQRFSIPGVAATEKSQKFDEQGAVRYIYRGSHSAGAIEKSAQIELVKFDDGRCQLSWKLSVINRGEKLRDQQGAMAYDCSEISKIKMHRRGAMHLLPRADLNKP